MTPLEALERIVHCLDRSFEDTHRSKAFVRALDTAKRLPDGELERRAADKTLTDLPGIGDSTAKVLTQAAAGQVPDYLTKLEATTQLVPKTDVGTQLRAALKGDCHLHSRWSDGAAPVLRMAETARDLGHEYLVLTDHSGRLTIAHGLNRERLIEQLDEIEDVRARLPDFRILTGMEVDINEDGTLDLDDDMLERLDVVVASVHSKLKMPSEEMTARMVRAVASPHVDILGHCTGRHLPKRGPSAFDPDYVFAACAQFGTAVEINCRPERLDPPPELLAIALEHGCNFAIDSDAHSTGQLEWQPFGCDIAATAGIPFDRIINTRSAADLLELVGR